MNLTRALALWLTTLAALACDGDISKRPGEGPIEGDEAGECSDGDDNDNNGQIDCDDAGCAASPDCSDTGTSGNSPPSAPTVAITPSDPEAGEALTCTVVTTAIDPDGDSVTHSFSWEVDGAGTSVDSDTVPIGQTGPSETWTCVVVADDGQADGPPGADSVTTAPPNTPPTAPVVAIVPESPAVNQPLRCDVLEPSTDADGDTITMEMAWLRDGAETGLTGDTVDRLETAEAETWTCIATPTDGIDPGEPATDDATITEAQYSGDITGLGGTVHTASSCFLGCDESTYHAPNAFDDNRGTSGYSTWHTTWTGGPEWIAIDFGEGNDKTVTRYGLMGASFHEGYRVRDFSLQGSHDGEAWVTVDSVTDASLVFVMYGGEAMTYYEHAHTDAYRHWRYLITDNEGGQSHANEVGIVEIEMFEDAPVE